MRKRVLQLIGSFHQGGSERQAVNLVRLLKNEDSFEVFAATLNNEGVLRAEIEKIGLPEMPEFPLSSFHDVNFIRQIWRCIRYLRDNKIDIVHTHDFYTNVFGMTAARLAGVPVRIASKRETGGMRSDGQNFVEGIVFRSADAIVVNSAAVRDYLIKRRTDLEKIHLIYNEIDPNRFTVDDARRYALREKYGLPLDPNIRFVTLVANLRHDVKNVPMLLRTAKRVSGVLGDVHFIVAGEGALESQLKEQAKMLGISRNVHFIGRCSDVPTLLDMSYACVLTSTAEGFSNSILEYMAAGKPVVASNVGGASEAIVDGETGFLVESDDEVMMSDRLIELLNDERKSLEFGVNGKRAVSERFSESSRVRSTIELYNHLLKEK